MNTQTAIPMQPVKSSQIKAIGHCPETNTLAVRFHGRDETEEGSLYHYANVSAVQFDEFLKAESIGIHFGKHFKKNPVHPYAKQ